MSTTSAEPQVVELTSMRTAVMRGVVEMTRIGEFFDRSFSTLAEVLGSQGISMAGPAIALYHSPPGDVIDLEVGFPVDGTVDPTQGVEPSELPGGRTAQLVHEGAYDDLGSSWERLDAWLREQGLTPGAAAWEVYLTEPRPDMDPAELRTELNWSLA